ncbi:MAG: hypothetical protein IT581_19810 [Verrucomicrobiales bacterium]|nr:hypothetical protein [Verrucomicrobiales bacterium]
MNNILVSVIVLALLASAATARAGEKPKPVKVFILAGQSNMEGQAVVDLEGEDYNGGKGTLAALMRDPAKAARLRHLRGADGKWTVRDDVWVRYRREDEPMLKGPLGVGFTVYGDAHHFGPELQFGHVVGDALENPVLLVKTAWGGKSLYKDFRPPSSGGEVGKYYRLMVAQVREALANLETEIPDAKGRGHELAGLVWYHGWNDGVEPNTAVPEYEQNLVNLIHDVRREFAAPDLPVVIGELTGPWVDAPAEWAKLRQAQAAAARRPEFTGRVVFVPTHDFVRPPDDSPNPGHGHHEFGNAETYFLVGDALGQAMVKLLSPPLREGEMSGYLIVPNEKVPKTFDAGFSMYVAAWPLLKEYPGTQFQTGLFGTWMFAQYEGAAPTNMYSDIEGGLGWWRDTRFATPTPKFIMGGVAPNFREWANGPGAGQGRDWNEPKGKYGVAQLSPWVLWPPDGLNLKQGTCGEWFGYGYLPLPLTEAKGTTAGQDVPTGNQSWTLFLNTGNFKGPVAFFTPYFWSHTALDEPRLTGLLLDTRPSDPNRALQMETQYVPSVEAADAKGQVYARIAETAFPRGPNGETPVVHRVTSYNRKALWDAVAIWFGGGPEATGAIDPAAAQVHGFGGRGGATWRIYTPDVPEKQRVPVAWKSIATALPLDGDTFGYRWNPDSTTRVDAHGGRRVILPEFYRLATSAGGKPEWEAVAPEDVPAETGLRQHRFVRPHEDSPEPYVTPDDPSSGWKKPGPVSGPFRVRLGDGSVVTYSWYRFADQPALLNADLTAEERERLQSRVEKLQRKWTKDREYLPPPASGRLADLDPALLVTPPPGMEAGFVPIVTRQEAGDPSGK